MTRAQLLAAGLIVAAGITVGGVLFPGGNDADAQSRPLTVDLRDVELHAAHISFQPDGTCTVRAYYSHKAPAGELSVAPQPGEYAFGGARCANLRDAAAKAAARDLKFTDAGTP